MLDKKVLVTGANGFLGSHLVERLINSGARVKCMLRSTSDVTWLEGMDYESVDADLTSEADLTQVVRDVDEIYHLAGIVRSADKEKLYLVNSEGTRRLVEAAASQNPDLERFVYVSSQAAWGPIGSGPVSHYGKSKSLAENWVKQLSSYSIVRPVAVYGPRDMDFLPILKMSNKGYFLKPSTGAGKLSFIHVSDCVTGILKSVCQTETFLSDGLSYSWEDFCAVMEKVFDREIKVVKIPGTVIRLAGLLNSFAGKFTGNPGKLNMDKVREIFAGDWIVPSTSVDPEYSLEAGLRNTVAWYRAKGLL